MAVWSDGLGEHHQWQLLTEIGRSELPGFVGLNCRFARKPTFSMVDCPLSTQYRPFGYAWPEWPQLTQTGQRIIRIKTATDLRISQN